MFHALDLSLHIFLFPKGSHIHDVTINVNCCYSINVQLTIYNSWALTFGGVSSI